MPPPSAAHEQRALYVSIVSTAVLGAIGVVWGIAVGSQMILLDGVYAGVEAVASIRAGGSEFTPGWAIAYGVITTVGSVATWRWLHARIADSDLLLAETTAWRIGALRGIGMVIGFSLMAVLVDSSWDDAAPYVDSAMVLITCVAFMGAPIRMMRTTVIELLEGSPATEVQEAVHRHVEAVRAEFDLADLEVRMTKVGPKLYVEIDGYVAPHVTVAQEHDVRTSLRDHLESLPYEIWLNLELTPADPSGAASAPSTTTPNPKDQR